MTGNGDTSDSITLALIDAKLDTVIEALARVQREHNDHEDRLRTLEPMVARQQERLGLVAAALAVLQVIGSGIAAWIGVRR